MELYSVDGDQLTLLCVKLPSLHNILQVFNPQHNFIDRSSGKLQSNMSLSRDYVAIHSYMWEITQNLEAFLNDRDGDSAASLEDYGIDFLRDSDLESDPELKEAMHHMSKDWQMRFFDMFV